MQNQAQPQPKSPPYAPLKKKNKKTIESKTKAAGGHGRCAIARLHLLPSTYKARREFHAEGRPTGASHKHNVLDDKNEGWGEATSVQMKTTPCKESANGALISQKLLKKKKQNLIVKLKSGQFPICVFIAACVCTITALYTSVYQLFSTALHPARLRYL
ncbi:hypothetical protein INR49_018692 [Caranx melampygus]|nr:hypothetical protein INR49_018692 [Caranx melampygus]